MDREDKWKVATWTLGTLGALGAFFATVPVEDAKTNIAGWLTFFGVDRVPDLLLANGVDFVAAVVSTLAALLSFSMRRATRQLEAQEALIEEDARRVGLSSGSQERLFDRFDDRDYG